MSERHKETAVSPVGKTGPRGGALAAATAALLAASAILTSGPVAAQSAGGATAPSDGAPADNGPGALARVSDAYARLAARIEPAVVHLEASGVTLRRSEDGTTARVAREHRTGSGVLLDARGYVVTNAHLVRAAREVRVTLPSRHPEGHPEHSVLAPSGQTVEARVLGTDRETDLAVLELPGEGYPSAELGDSEGLRTGDLVFAFGSPLGLRSSTSAGVVSKVARQLEPEDPMIYIQTDAAINPGNSGGPLVSARGEVVGINTFILTRSGGSQGVGFAAPSNIVEHVYREILAHGRVRRGVIGVHAQTVTPTLARALDLTRSWGVVLADVFPSGPAAGAGLERGDLVVSLNGQPMENGRQFDVNVYPFGPGDSVEVTVLRDGRRRSFRVPVRRRPETMDRLAELVSPEENLVPRLGVMAMPLTLEVARMLPPLRSSSGVVVVAAAGRRVGGRRKLRTGDVIHAVNGRPVASPEELRSALGRVRPGAAVVLEVERDSRFRYLAFELSG